MYPFRVHGCVPSGMGHKPAIADRCGEHMCSGLQIGLCSVQARVVNGRHTSGTCVPADVCCCVWVCV